MSYSVAAGGVSGRVSVDVLRAETGENILWIQTPLWEFQFEVEDPESVRSLSAFLTRYDGREEFAALTIGTFDTVPVRIVKDCEFADHFFLRAGREGLLLDFPLVSDLAKDFIIAARSAADGL